MESSMFKTSTPKRMNYENECEDCADKTEYVECTIKRFREEHGLNGGGPTAQCTSTSGCSILGILPLLHLDVVVPAQASCK